MMKKTKVAYPKAEEELIDFLNMCKLNNYEVMFFPICISVFDKDATKAFTISITI